MRFAKDYIKLWNLTLNVSIYNYKLTVNAYIYANNCHSAPCGADENAVCTPKQYFHDLSSQDFFSFVKST